MPPTPAPVLGLLQPSLGPCCYHGVALFGLSRSPLVLWEVSFFGISCFLFLHLFDVGREREKEEKKKKKRLCKQHKPSQKLLSGCGLCAPGQLSLLPCLLEESSSHQKCCFGLCDQTQTHIYLLRLHHPQQGSQVTQCCPCCLEGRPREWQRCCASGCRRALSRGSDAQSFLLASFLPAVARQARMVLLIK